MKIKNNLLKIVFFYFCSLSVFAQITDTGNKVGIGTTNPSEKLDVNGNIKIPHNAFITLNGKTTAGQGGFIQGTGEAGSNAGYGTWLNYNAYWDGANWRQPRGSLGTKMFTSNHHFGWSWRYAASNGVHDAIITPVEVAKLNTNGTLNIIGNYKINGNDINTAGTLTNVSYKNQNNNFSVDQTFSGNVGIGTNSPLAKLQVNSSSTIAWNNLENATILVGTPTSGIGIDNNEIASKGDLYLGTINPGNNINIIAGGTATRMIIDGASGNIGIGTTTPDSKLTVKGKIHAQEVKVTVNAGADFVFEKEYDLPSLLTVENYIAKNKHLPEIASAKEMEVNGIHLSEMNIKLLQKIEELTLYTIQQEKAINQLLTANSQQQLAISEERKANKKLRKEMREQSNEIEQLKKIVNQLIDKN